MQEVIEQNRLNYFLHIRRKKGSLRTQQRFKLSGTVADDSTYFYIHEKREVNVDLLNLISFDVEANFLFFQLPKKIGCYSRCNCRLGQLSEFRRIQPEMRDEK